MAWTPEDMEGDAELSVWLHRQKLARRRRFYVGLILVAAALLATWTFAAAMSGSARVARAHDQWLKDNGCKVTSHTDSSWKYHWLGDYTEYIPSMTCYRCKKTGEAFCE